MQGYIQDGLHALGVCLPYLPRLTFGDILVADACQVHGFFLRLAELEGIQVIFHLRLDVLELIYGSLVHLGQFATLGHHSIPVLLGQLQGSVDEIAIDGHQL